jgi:hypothetical protein
MLNHSEMVGRRTNLLQEGSRIGAHPAEHVGVFEQVIVSLGKEVTKQTGLARAAGAGEKDGWELPNCRQHLGAQMASNVANLKNPKCNLKSVKPLERTPSAEAVRVDTSVPEFGGFDLRFAG